ncbi:MAG: hypothetical protein OXH63_06570 [Gemmatimonadetes bacterium]|nr:hypothetical protein [Gemmatimonadota bacterium]
MHITAAFSAIFATFLTLSASAKADVCSDFRLALLERNAIRDLIDQRNEDGWADNGLTSRELFELLADSESELSSAMNAVAIDLSDQRAATAISSLESLEEHVQELRGGTIKNWNNQHLPKDSSKLSAPDYNPLPGQEEAIELGTRMLKVLYSIWHAKEAATALACHPNKKEQ